MKVWIDPDLCTGDGQCADICPEVFVMGEADDRYVADVRNSEVDPASEAAVLDAAEDCPGACIFVE